MKIAPNFIKAEVKFDKDEMYLIHFLATKYNEGCIPSFIHELVMNEVKTTFAEEIREYIASPDRK